MISYRVYRDGGGAVEARVKQACQRFYKDLGKLPSCIVVNPAEKKRPGRPARRWS